jgi:hypothetical protein
MARNLIQVLNQILSHVPEEDDIFKDDILHAINNASYAPPEVMHNHWNLAQDIITKKFKPYKELKDIPAWGQEIIKIWTNRPT